MKTLRAAALVLVVLGLGLALIGARPVESGSVAAPNLPTALRPDIPLPDDADVVFTSPEYIIFHTAGTVEEIVDFFKQKMPEQGWESFVVMLRIQDVGCQSYIKGDEAVYILITPAPTNTGVMIRITGVTEPWRMPARDETPTVTPVSAPLTPSPQPTAELRVIRGVPLLPDGVVDFNAADIIGYHSFVGVQAAGEFYEREMPQRGWQPAADNSVAAELATLSYSQGLRSVSLIIYPGVEGQTNILITLGAGD